MREQHFVAACTIVLLGRLRLYILTRRIEIFQQEIEGPLYRCHRLKPVHWWLSTHFISVRFAEVHEDIRSYQFVLSPSKCRFKLTNISQRFSVSYPSVLGSFVEIRPDIGIIMSCWCLMSSSTYSWLTAGIINSWKRILIFGGAYINNPFSHIFADRTKCESLCHEK